MAKTKGYQRIEYCIDINTRRYGYIYAKEIESETFYPAPDESVKISLLQVKKGYGFKDGYAILEDFNQPASPTVSLHYFTNSADAGKVYAEMLKENSELYPI